MSLGRFANSILLLFLAANADADLRPNIVVIFADDQGFADAGAQGVRVDIRTPHIDRIAQRGIRMTCGFVTAPQCMPSRVALLTGQYQQRAGVEGNTTGRMREAVPTIASELRKLGYVTGMSGKWGVGGGPNWRDIQRDSRQIRTEDLPRLPAARGFDEYFSGVTTLYATSHDLAGEPISDAPQVVRSDDYRVAAQAKAAVQFIERQAAAERPFFLYYAPYSPHAPFVAPPEYLDQFAGVVDRRRRTCLAMMAALDASVGDIVATLDEHQLLENTLLWYISDNGAPANGGGVNQPWNGWKGSLYDGGVRVPFIVSWPARLARGRDYAEMVSALDVLPTCLRAAGCGVLPAGLDGVDLLPFLTDQRNSAPHEELFFQWMGQSSLRTKQWKLLIKGGELLLFDLDHDPGETRDVGGDYGAVRDRMQSRLEAWRNTIPRIEPAKRRRPRRRKSNQP